jgi:transposase
MARVWIDSDQGCQGELISLDAGHVLPADHPARDVIRLVNEMDLSAFEAAYRADGRGRPPYHPRVIVALLLYCRSDGRVGGQQVVDACYDDLGARLITGNQFPDRRTLDRFLETHRAALAALLPQTLRLGHGRGLVDVSIVAGDGTMVQANAAMGATVTEDELLAQIAGLEQRLDAALGIWQILVGADQTGQPSMLEGLVTASADPDEELDLTRIQQRRPPIASTVADTATATDAGVAGADTTPKGGAVTPPVTADKAWRRVRTLWDMLRARRTALARLRQQPSTASVGWQQRFERDQQRVQRCDQRLTALRAKVQAANERRALSESADGVKGPGRRPVPVEEHSDVRRARQSLDKATARAQATATTRPIIGRINTTDPASRLMPAKHGGYDQLHNVQALACKNQFVIAIGVHDSPNDKQALVELLLNGRANLDHANITDRIKAALFDCGYASTTNFTADLPVDLLLVSVEKEARQTGRLRDGTSTAGQSWQDMAERLAEPANSALYKRRGAIIEPLFAQLFARFGRRIHVRDEHVETELHLWAITHNLLKIARHDRRATTARPG